MVSAGNAQEFYLRIDGDYGGQSGKTESNNADPTSGQGTTAPSDAGRPWKIPTQFVNANGTGVNTGVRYAL